MNERALLSCRKMIALFIQPITHTFIRPMKGILRDPGLPSHVERNRDRMIR